MTTVYRNVNPIPQPTVGVNGVSKDRRDFAKFRPGPPPPSGMPTLSPTQKISKVGKFATEFYNTIQGIKKQQAYQQGIYDYLGIEPPTAIQPPPVVKRTKEVNTREF